MTSQVVSTSEATAESWQDRITVRDEGGKSYR